MSKADEERICAGEAKRNIDCVVQHRVDQLNLDLATRGANIRVHTTGFNSWFLFVKVDSDWPVAIHVQDLLKEDLPVKVYERLATAIKVAWETAYRRGRDSERQRIISKLTD